VNRTTHRPLLGALAVSVTLLAAACGASGGSDDAGKQDPTTTTAKATTTTTETAPDDDAQARAESIDLSVSDFPDGFTATPASDEEGPSGIDQCTDEASDDDVTGEYATDDFTAGDLDAGDGVQVSVKTKVFTDEAAAEAALEPFSDPDVVSCLDDLFKQQFESNGSTVDGSIAIEDYGDTTADQAGLVGGRLTVTTSDGQEVPLTVAVVTLRTGDVATALMATGVGPSIDSVDISGVATRIEELQADA
jgi:hypothetical protein